MATYIAGVLKVSNMIYRDIMIFRQFIFTVRERISVIARGASSPAKPALHIPDPLSTTNAATSASHIFYWDFQFNWLCRNQSLGCIVLEMQFQALYEYFIMSYPGYYLPWADVTQNICCGLILNGCVAFQHHIESKILFFAIIKSFQQPRNDSPLQFSQFYNNVQDLCDDSFYLTIQIRS